ncbi:TPA: hypothetical protein ACOTFU_002897 [Clostridium perfringens]
MKHKLLTDENYKKCAEIFGNENCYFKDGWTLDDMLNDDCFFDENYEGIFDIAARENLLVILDDKVDINIQLEREKHKANPGEIIKVLFDVIDEYKRRIAERD